MPAPSIDGLPILSPHQQDLLLAALSSAKRNVTVQDVPALDQKSSFGGLATPTDGQSALTNAIDPAIFASPLETDLSTSNYGQSTFGDSLFPDFVDSGTTFDVDFPSNGDDFVDGFPKFSPDSGLDGEIHEKRKSMEDDEEDDEEGDYKRREGDDKIAKKPGRKPLMSEPTTVRYLQPSLRDDH